MSRSGPAAQARGRRLLRLLAGRLGARADALASAGAFQRALHELDPAGLTEEELSVKFSGGRARPLLRLLHMDAAGYSCRGERMFSLRTAAAAGLTDASLPGAARVRAALESAARTPMDLYLGGDWEGPRCATQGYWLILGGVGPDGRASYWPYDPGEVLAGVLSGARLRRPETVRPRLLNIGLDLAPGGLACKLYYLCSGDRPPGPRLAAARRRLERAFRGRPHFSFFSEAFDEEGRKVKEKLFLEFQGEELLSGPEAERLFRGLGEAAGGASRLREEARRVLEGLPARISLVSLEPDGTLTAYLRAPRGAAAGPGRG